MTATSAPRPHPDDMPYTPSPSPGRCELCWQPADVLRRIVLEPSRPISFEVAGKQKSGWRAARVLYVCNRHPGELTQGGPIVTPNARLVEGSTTRRPQREALFDDTGLKRGSAR